MGRFGCWNPRAGGGRFCGRPRSETRRRSGMGSTSTPTMCRWRATMARWRTPTYSPATWPTFPGRTRPRRCSLLGIHRGSPPRSSTAWDQIIFPRRKTIRECRALPPCWEAPTLTCANTLSSRPSRSCGANRCAWVCSARLMLRAMFLWSAPGPAFRWPRPPSTPSTPAAGSTRRSTPAGSRSPSTRRSSRETTPLMCTKTYSKAPARLPAVGVLSGPRSCQISMPTSWFAPPTALVPIHGGLA